MNQCCVEGAAEKPARKNAQTRDFARDWMFIREHITVLPPKVWHYPIFSASFSACRWVYFFSI